MTNLPNKTQVALAFGSDAPLTMSSLEISALTGKRHDHVIRDIRAMLDALKDAPDLGHVREDKDARGYTAMFHLDRELTDTLLTGYSVPMRRKVVARWHELEAKVAAPLQPPVALPDFTNPAIAARAWAEQFEAKEQAQQQLAIAAPKAQALDRIAQAEGDMCITDAAKDLGMKPRTLMAWLEKNRWVYRRGGASKPVAYQDRIQSGHLTHKVTAVQREDGTEKMVAQVIVTPKGLAKLAEVAA